MITLINLNHLKIIVYLSGNAIRGFLFHADPGEFQGEAREAIRSFQSKPLDFSNDRLLAYGAGADAIDYPLRIEVRGVSLQGAAQVVAKGIWGPKRGDAATELLKKCRELGLDIHLKLAGTSSIEFNVEGVDKSLPIRFLEAALDDVLKEMEYQPGEYINSRLSRTVIAADGDGTLYDGPRPGLLPSLAESPVKEALCAYLQAGGLFMLISGNDINRTVRRVVDALPAQAYGRVLIAGNGGAELVYVNAKGQAMPVANYKSQALCLQENQLSKPALDIVYIGDDGSREGNDYAAFKAVGFNRSVVVAPEFLEGYDPGLKPGYLGGSLQGTKKFLEHFLKGRMSAGRQMPG